MAVSFFHRIQSLPLSSSRSRIFFRSVGDNYGVNNTQKKSSHVVFASTKKSAKDLCLQSKVLNNMCLNANNRWHYKDYAFIDQYVCTCVRIL